MNLQPTRAVTFLLIAGSILATCSACKPKEEITTYSVERTSPPGEPFVAAEVSDQLDRTLAAMLPLGDEVYFFKLAGKAPAIARHHDEFKEFLTTVGKGDSADTSLKWKLPDGWTEKGPSEMRLNTIAIPDEAGELAIAVSSLPMSGSWDEFVAINVNRWLGQLSQGELPRQTILNLTKKVATEAGPATVIEVAGVLKETMPMNPHGGAATTSEPAAPPRSTATAPATGNAPLTFETPTGWQPGQVSMMRKAAFQISEGDKQAEFTAIDLPSAGGPQVTDVMANVQRWAAQVGMPVDDKLAELVEEIEIDGIKGGSVKLVGPDSAARKAMLAAMVVRSDKVWFFKLFGDAALVDRQDENFRKFLESVRFK